MLKNLIAKLIGKHVGGNLGTSKTKLIAIVYVLVNAVPVISTAWGNPIEVPPVILRLLEGAGLWSMRDALKTPDVIN